jgi:hypothetical protein
MGLNNWDACNWSIYTGRWDSIASYWGSPKDDSQPDSLKANPVGYWLYKEKGYLHLSSSPEMVTLSDEGRTASKGWTLVTLPAKEVSSMQGLVGSSSRNQEVCGNHKRVPGQRLGVQFAQVNYTWVYSLTPLGIELFKNERIPNTGRGSDWGAPAALTGISLKKTYEDQTTFTLTMVVGSCRKTVREGTFADRKSFGDRWGFDSDV